MVMQGSFLIGVTFADTNFTWRLCARLVRDWCGGVSWRLYWPSSGVFGVLALARRSQLAIVIDEAGILQVADERVQPVGPTAQVLSRPDLQQPTFRPR